MSFDGEVTNESALCWEEISSYLTKKYHGIFRFGHVALDVFSFPLEGSGAGLDVVTYPTCKKTRQRLP